MSRIDFNSNMEAYDAYLEDREVKYRERQRALHPDQRDPDFEDFEEDEEDYEIDDWDTCDMCGAIHESVRTDTGGICTDCYEQYIQEEEE